jgi:hypothetical protein
LHLGAVQNQDDFQKALYIENASSRIHVQDIQLFVNKNFSFQIVSQTTSPEDRNPEDFASYLTEAIQTNGITLLVKTRKPKKLKLRKSPKEDLNDFLGLPILSLYEEMV